MKLSDLDYDYPESLVADYPLENRDQSKMMLLDRKANKISNQKFSDLTQYLIPNDVLVLNNSKVFPCRLIGHLESGGKVECFLLRETSPKVWDCLIKSSKKIKIGKVLHFSDDFYARVLAEDGLVKKVELICDKDILDILEDIAHIPLPPYIKRSAEDKDTVRYQTVYADRQGSVAAPTAGFHFTWEMINQLEKIGVKICYLTLHVGVGTFTPIRTDDIKNHHMHAEYYEVPEETIVTINQAKENNHRVIGVGTTTVRALEGMMTDHGKLIAGMNLTKHFIYPPYQFKIIDGLITNFHQPKTTLLALVCAFAGVDFTLKAYQEAIEHQYRLFSYGDCMLIL